jgi:hypothetical protein
MFSGGFLRFSAVLGIPAKLNAQSRRNSWVVDGFEAPTSL